MTHPVRLLVAMEDDVLIVDQRDRDNSRARTELSGLAPQCLAADPHNPRRLYCATFGHGLWRSDDVGDSWQRVSGLNAQQVTSVAVSAKEVDGEFGTVFVGTEPSEIFRSNDGASTWQQCAGLDRLPSAPTWSFPPRPETHHVRWISLDPAAPDRLFVAIEAGALICSVDGGATWRDRVQAGPYDTHTLVSAGGDSNHLYVAAGDGYFESDDGGATWRKPEAGLEHRYLWSVAIEPHEAKFVIVSAARDPWSAHGARNAESYLYSRANGRDWTVIRDGLPPPKGTTISSVIADPAQTGVFYAANNHGIYRSHGGLTWEKLKISWPEHFHGQRAHALVLTSRV